MITLDTTLTTMKESSDPFFVELYVLSLVSGELYFTSADVDIQYFIPGTSTVVTYIAQPLERGEIKASVDSRVDSCSITISDVTNEFLSALFESFDFRGSNVDIYEIAYPGSLGNSNAYTQMFAGYIDAPSLDCSKATFSATLKARSPNLETYRTVSATCNAWFGDADECGVTQATKTTTVGTGSTQVTLYSTAITETANYWKSGVCTIGFESKKIIASTVGSVTVEYPFYSVPSVGLNFNISSGCDKTATDCKKWNNLTSFSGFPAVVFEYSVKT